MIITNIIVAYIIGVLVGFGFGVSLAKWYYGVPR